MMTDEAANNFSISGQTGFSPLGEVFVAARNAKNLTLKDASNHLRLSIKQIEALENNDFANLPQAMITRGFIRNYARLLEVDAEPLLESYSKRMPEMSAPALSVVTSMTSVDKTKKISTTSQYLLVGLLLGLPLLAWFFYQNNTSKSMPEKAVAEQAAPAVVNSTTPTFNANPLPEIALPAAERQPENESLPSVDATSASDIASQQAGLPTQQISNVAKEEVQNPKVSNAQEMNAQEVNKSAATPTQTPAQSSADEDFHTLKEKAAQKAKAAQAVTAGAPQTGVTEPSIVNATSLQKMDLSVSEQTWVRVRDKSGAVVFEKLLEPNSTAGFDGKPPFNVWIGNAKATTLTYSGKAVDLTANTKNNIARIKLE